MEYSLLYRTVFTSVYLCFFFSVTLCGKQIITQSDTEDAQSYTEKMDETQDKIHTQKQLVCQDIDLSPN